MIGRHKSSGSRPKLIRRPKRKPAGPIRGGLFAGCAIHSDGFVIEDDDADDPIIVWGGTRHDSGNDASGAGEDAIANDGDDQAGAGAVRSPAGRWALRSSRNGDRLRSESRKIYLDDENDVLRRLRDVAARCRQPERFYLGVLVFPKKADGWVRVVADQMVPTTEVSPGTLRQRPPSSPGGGKIDLDDENDVLRRIRDAGDRCREPKRFYLGVLVFPKKADGRVRLVADHMAPSTNVSPKTPRQRPPSPPVAQPGLKPPERLRPRARDE
jgi:hypothetical protein